MEGGTAQNKNNGFCPQSGLSGIVNKGGKHRNQVSGWARGKVGRMLLGKCHCGVLGKGLPVTRDGTHIRAGWCPGFSTYNQLKCLAKTAAQVLGACHPWGRSGQSSWLTALPWAGLGHCCYLGSEPADGGSLSSPFSVTDFQINNKYALFYKCYLGCQSN